MVILYEPSEQAVHVCGRLAVASIKLCSHSACMYMTPSRSADASQAGLITAAL